VRRPIVGTKRYSAIQESGDREGTQTRKSNKGKNIKVKGEEKKSGHSLCRDIRNSLTKNRENDPLKKEKKENNRMRSKKRSRQNKHEKGKTQKNNKTGDKRMTAIPPTEGKWEGNSYL